MSADVPEFDESLMPLEQPAELALIELDHRHLAYAAARWPDKSERMQQYRVRQAIWTRFEHRKPHPDDPSRRKLGGPQPNSGPKPETRQLGAAIVEEAQRRQREIIDAAFAPLDRKNPDLMQRHKAAMNLAKLEMDKAAMDIVEDEYARKTSEEVIRDSAAMFADMIRKGELKLEDIIDGTADDVTDESPQLSA